jgi:predicted nucleic acid-binding protein
VARNEVPDTGVLIQVVRDAAAEPAFLRAIASGRRWLSSVVVAELYAGTRSREDALVVDRMVAAMQHVGRLLTPTAGEWERAGRLIARYVRLHGALRPRDHLADVLILVSAARLSGTVVTANVRHFESWARLATAAGLDVAVIPYELSPSR